MGVAEVEIGRREGEPGKAVQAGKRGKRLTRDCHISMASGPNHSSLDRQILQNDDQNDKTH